MDLYGFPFWHVPGCAMTCKKILSEHAGQTEKLQHWRKDAGWWSAWRHVLPGEDSAARWGQSHSPGLHSSSAEKAMVSSCFIRWALSLWGRVTKIRPLRCILQRIGRLVALKVAIFSSNFLAKGGTWHQHEDFMLMMRELHRQNALLLAWIFPGDRLMDEGYLPDPREDPRNNGLVQVPEIRGIDSDRFM